MGYTAAQIANIKTIIAEGRAMGEQPPEILIAIMTALTESSAQNYANVNSPASLALPHDAVGSDHGSVGIFQQQSGQVPGNTANWGSIADLMNPRIAAEKFYQAFDSKRSQMTGLTPAQDAQLVQGSAITDGSNYAANQAAAAAAFNAYNGTSQSFLDRAWNGATSPVTTVVGGAEAAAKGAVSTVTDLNSALKAGTATLTSTAFWIRVGFVVLGFVILIIGINELAKASGGSSEPAPIIDVEPSAPAEPSTSPAPDAPTGSSGPASQHRGAGRAPVKSSGSKPSKSHVHKAVSSAKDAATVAAE